MKASELRIGNLVYRTNKLTKEKLTIELTASCILDIHANGEMSSFIYEPIQSTEEWLFKFGIEKLKHSNEWCFIMINGFELSIHLSGYEICFGNGQIYLKGDFKYVHKIQNLYFALTNEELTIK